MNDLWKPCLWIATLTPVSQGNTLKISIKNVLQKVEFAYTSFMIANKNEIIIEVLSKENKSYFREKGRI